LNSEAKAAYDAQLRESLAPAAPPPVAPVPPPLGQRPVKRPRSSNRHRGPAIAGATALGAALAVFLLGAIYPALDFFGVFRPKSTDGISDVVAAPTETDVHEPPVATESQQEQHPAEPAGEPAESVTVAHAEETPAPASNIANGSTNPEIVTEAPLAPESKGVPDAAELEDAATALQRVLESELPEQLLQRSQAADVAPAERFVLLQAARDKAAAALDVAVSLQAAAETTKHFDVDPLPENFDTILVLDEALKISETAAPAACRALAAAALPLIKQLAARGEHEEAAQCADAALRAARKSDDSSLIRQATLAALEVQQSNSR
jgi:hypothetical protein